MLESQTREQQPAVTIPATPSAPPPAPPPAADPATEVRALAQLANADAATTQALIAMNASPEQARAFLTQQLSTRAAPPPMAATVTATGLHDDPTQTRALIAEALYARHNPAHKPSEPARLYMGMTMLDIARDRLRAAGANLMGLSPAETVTRAMSTSDFPVIFADTANRTLLARYNAFPLPIRSLARQATAKDFRAKTVLKLDDSIELKKVMEWGEFTHDNSLIEAKESYRIFTFGRILALSRQAIINDDLGALNDLSARLGDAAARFEAQSLVDLLVANAGLGPTMDDGSTLFHANHRNVSATGAPLSETTLSAARLAMHRQQTPAGELYPVTAKYLVVPPELETEADKLLTVIQANKTADVNPFGGKLSLLTEPRLIDAHRWYLAADPASLPCLEYSYLQGQEGPQIETKTGFEVDGVQIKVRLDFGAAFLDWRGWYSNAGQ